MRKRLYDIWIAELDPPQYFFSMYKMLIITDLKKRKTRPFFKSRKQSQREKINQVHLNLKKRLRYDISFLYVYETPEG